MVDNFKTSQNMKNQKITSDDQAFNFVNSSLGGNPNIRHSKDYGWVFIAVILITAIVSYLIW